MLFKEVWIGGFSGRICGLPMDWSEVYVGSWGGGGKYEQTNPPEGYPNVRADSELIMKTAPIMYGAISKNH